MARGSSVPRSRGPWSRCPDCGVCEYNAELAKAVCTCRGCGSRAPLYKARATSAGRSRVTFDLSDSEDEL
eukprot:1806387-Pyramimonas_sp.AAC.1